MEKSLFSIRQVIELTGVSEYVLRAWELRYGALKPERTETGRRLYTKHDLEKARALFELTQKNHKIGDIASLGLAKLQSMLTDSKVNQKADPIFPPEVQDILLATQKFDWERVRKILLSSRKSKKTPRFIQDLILPLLQAINLQVSGGNLSIAQEHILSALIKENLNALNVEKLPTDNKHRIVFACPEGDMHDIGLLIALAFARHAGVSTLYLGPHTPKVDLCDSVLRFQATHLLLSSTISKREGAKEEFLHYLSFLDQQLPKKVNFWLAGRNVNPLTFSLNRAHQKLESFQQLEESLKSLSK